MIATTRGALVRGVTTKDALGDEVESDVVVPGFESFPFSAIEKTRREFDESSNAWRTVRYFAGRVSSRVPVRAGDRIRDLRDGAIFSIDEAERMPRGLGGRSSVTLTMKRTTP